MKDVSGQTKNKNIQKTRTNNKHEKVYFQMNMNGRSLDGIERFQSNVVNE